MNDSYQNLANAVVKRAADDYREALCEYELYKDSTTSKDQEKAIEAEKMINDCERFFTGDVIDLYTKIDCVVLMNKLKQQVEAFNYDIKALYEAQLSYRRVGIEES